MRSIPRLLCTLIAIAPLPLALAACKKDQPKTAEARTAQGQILPGSASDAMLPLDTVRSQPPLAPEEAPSGKPGRISRGGAGGSDDSADEPSVPDAAPAPGPSIAPETVQ